MGRKVEKFALKVYDPRFLLGTSGAAELHRLTLQRALIGHDCPNLVTMYRVEEKHGTAFVEMENLAWPDLKDVLAAVPDQFVLPLIRQLVVAVRFLEAKGVVHRDIKPENIKVAPDFFTLKLLDLGVVRELERVADQDADATDHGTARPFLATAQYSSPEYLFRTNEPSPKLWKALSLYQVGAVLHDLIEKEAIFQEEVKSENRFLVAHAVLSKVPVFHDADHTRLAQLKSLACSCLVKDMDLRLALVDWSSFDALDQDAVLALRQQLQKRKLGVSDASERAAKLRFERSTCIKRIREATRTALIEICNSDIPISCAIAKNGGDAIEVGCQIVDDVVLNLLVSFTWSDGLDEQPAVVCLKNRVDRTGLNVPVDDSGKTIGIAHAQGEGEDQLVVEIVSSISIVLTAVLRIQEAGDAELDSFIGKSVVL